jgi:glutathione S-transferase
VKANGRRVNPLIRTTAKFARPLLIRFPISHYCHKVEWALHYAGIPYDYSNVGLATLRAFHDINPENTVPVLIVDGERICGSNAIMQWMDRVAPGAGLYADKQAAKWETWADEEVGLLARRSAYRTAYEQPTWYTNQPAIWAALRAARPILLNVLKAYKASRFYADDDVACPTYLAKIGNQLEKSGARFLFGAAPTAADFAVAALTKPILRIRKGPMFEVQQFATLRAYADRVRGAGNSTRRRRRRWTRTQRATMAALPVAR